MFIPRIIKLSTPLIFATIIYTAENNFLKIATINTSDAKLIMSYCPTIQDLVACTTKTMVDNETMCKHAVALAVSDNAITYKLLHYAINKIEQYRKINNTTPCAPYITHTCIEPIFTQLIRRNHHTDQKHHWCNLFEYVNQLWKLDITIEKSDNTVPLWDNALSLYLATRITNNWKFFKKDIEDPASSILNAINKDAQELIKTYIAQNISLLFPLLISAKPTLLTGHTDTVYSAKFSPDDKKIVSASADKTIHIWDASLGTSLYTSATHKSTTSFTDRIEYAEFSPDGSLIMAAAYDGTIYLWNAANYCLIHTSTDHQSPISTAHFSPNGKFIITEPRGNIVCIFDTTQHKLLHTLTHHRGGVNKPRFLSDCRALLPSDDHTISLIDIISGTVLHTLIGHTQSVLSVEISPDERLIASGSFDNTIRLWDTKNFLSLHTFTGHTNTVRCMQFSPNGKLLVSGSYDHTVRLWDMINYRLLHTFTNHTNLVRCVVFSPNGQFIASAAYDKIINVWNVNDYRLWHTFTDHTEWISSIQFSSDGSKLLSTSGDGTIRIWDCSNTTYPWHKSLPMLLDALHSAHKLKMTHAHRSYWMDIKHSIFSRWK